MRLRWQRYNVGADSMGDAKAGLLGQDKGDGEASQDDTQDALYKELQAKWRNIRGEAQPSEDEEEVQPELRPEFKALVAPVPVAVTLAPASEAMSTVAASQGPPGTPRQ